VNSASALPAFGRPGVRVRTLVALRWIAILGQLVTLGYVGLYLGFPLPWGPALAAVGAGVLLNVGLTVLYQRPARLQGGGALLHLSFDLYQLAVLLFLTGGLDNPFSALLVVPVTVAATLLRAREAAVLFVGAVASLVALWNWALPLPWHGPPPTMPELYRLGLFVAVVSSSAFLGAYIARLTAEARSQAAALFATQTALERETKMSALGSLAAAAAHELGGPLGTITLVARDLDASLAGDPDFGDDIRLLNQEVTRARDILASLAGRAEAEEPFPRLGLPALLHEVAEPFVNARVPVRVKEGAAVPVIRRSPELLHGLSNLIDNAVRHAATCVTLDGLADGSEIMVVVRDDGDGFDPDLLPVLGEPFLGPSRSRDGGTGLGVFISTTLLERTGARVVFGNAPEGGARVEIRWPRHHIEAND
jgi:two-component system sensor histidine kinase RegB